MADWKQKWRHVVTQPRERKSKKNSTKTQQKQNALTTILITTKKWVRRTRLGTTCSDLRPLQRPLFVRRPEEPKVLTLQRCRDSSSEEAALERAGSGRFFFFDGPPLVPALLTTIGKLSVVPTLSPTARQLSRDMNWPNWKYGAHASKLRRLQLG